MVDFKNIIESARADDLRHEFHHFLVDYEDRSEFVSRMLTTRERALLRRVFDAFVIDSRFMEGECSEVDELCERLSRYANQEILFPVDDEIRNDCFNACSRLKTLMLSISRCAAVNRILREGMSMLSEDQKKNRSSEIMRYEATLESFFADMRPMERWPCQVILEEHRIVVSYDDVIYQGTSDGSGHFELICPQLRARATLHRAVDYPNSLEGSWVEEGEMGMWRIDLDDE